MWLLQQPKERSCVTYKADGAGFNGHVMSIKVFKGENWLCLVEVTK